MCIYTHIEYSLSLYIYIYTYRESIIHIYIYICRYNILFWVCPGCRAWRLGFGFGTRESSNT